MRPKIRELLVSRGFEKYGKTLTFKNQYICVYVAPTGMWSVSAGSDASVEAGRLINPEQAEALCVLIGAKEQ